MEWRSWITWRIILCIGYSRLFWIYLKRHGEKTDNPSLRIYVNKIGNRITFRKKAGYYLELLTPETMKLLESTINKSTKNGNGQNVPHLEITKAILVQLTIWSIVAYLNPQNLYF